MNQLNSTGQQPVDEGPQPQEQADPNQLVAMSLYYPPLTPALIGLCVVVLVAIFSRDFPNIFFFGSAVSSQGIIAALSVLSAFLFLEAARMGFFAHANDLYGMDRERRQSIFLGYDPFEKDIKNTGWFDWKIIIEKAEVITKMYQFRAVGYFVLGSVALFLSVSLLLTVYVLWLGIGTLILTCVYMAFQVIPVLGLIRQYRRFSKRLGELNQIPPPRLRPLAPASTPVVQQEP